MQEINTLKISLLETDCTINVLYFITYNYNNLKTNQIEDIHGSESPNTMKISYFFPQIYIIGSFPFFCKG